MFALGSPSEALRFGELFGHFRKSGGMPCVEAADDIDDVPMSGSLEQAARDHAAIAALTVNRQWLNGIDVRKRLRESIERPALRLCDVARLPFTVAANVEHTYASFAQPLMQLLWGNLCCACERKSRLLPRGHAAS